MTKDEIEVDSMIISGVGTLYKIVEVSDTHLRMEYRPGHVEKYLLSQIDPWLRETRLYACPRHAHLLT